MPTPSTMQKKSPNISPFPQRQRNLSRSHQPSLQASNISKLISFITFQCQKLHYMQRTYPRMYKNFHDGSVIRPTDIKKYAVHNVIILFKQNRMKNVTYTATFLSGLDRRFFHRLHLYQNRLKAQIIACSISSLSLHRMRNLILVHIFR